ncbi:DUF2207 domain-containing protein [Agreia sp. VKM Ac-1783]|uniref:DUF2207 family protein n=1 Tax=Agreia sp. VKM Ac-1783 TaxID=1938889 RepID=UPI000A2AE402|nr:DUF2207 domain-containing protein [Agreia sp. VKM Ac-1783]SMQ71448.1 Predicted membrane protein [Agreia sp. VKM Ac-1783]
MRPILLTALVVIGLGSAGVGGAASGAAAAVAAAPVASGVSTGVDDFSFSSYDVDFYLDSDSEGRSTLKTVETFVAEFPETDQNRGIRRAIPLDYDGHPTDVDIESVVDENGDPRSFTAEENGDGDFLVVTVRADEFVHGAQSYTFTYTQHNVTRHDEATDVDEFYWDSVGFDSLQSFGSATVRLHVPDRLAQSLTGKASCYAGLYGSTTGCPLASEQGDGETIFTAGGVPLGAHENVTVAVGFDPATFVPRDDSYLGAWQGWAQLAAALLAVTGAVLAIIWRTTGLRDARGRPTIIAEYTPPASADIFTSSVILKRTNRAAASGFVALAVRGNLQIVEKPSDSMWSKKPEYWLHGVHSDGLSTQELEFYRMIFDGTPDNRRELTKNDTALATDVQKFIKKARSTAVRDGFFKKGTSGRSLLLALMVFAAGVATMVFGAMLNSESRGGSLPFIPMAVGALCVAISWLTLFRTPLTSSGAELRDYLKGIQLYLTVAEEERFRMLQSPEGALKTQGAASDGGQIVKIYEKLLPFAVLWGVEDEWAKVLGTYYERTQTQPHWYGGSTSFNAAYFAASVGSFAASSAAGYSGSSASTSSSSSGGSGGGGFSGGGGGGGGVGGV